MATRISQEQLNKFISPEAAMAPYQRAQEDKKQRVAGEQAMEQQRAQADAKLAELIKGNELTEATDNRTMARDIEAATGLRGLLGKDANVHVGKVGFDPRNYEGQKFSQGMEDKVSDNERLETKAIQDEFNRLQAKIREQIAAGGEIKGMLKDPSNVTAGALSAKLPRYHGEVGALAEAEQQRALPTNLKSDLKRGMNYVFGGTEAPLTPAQVKAINDYVAKQDTALTGRLNNTRAELEARAAMLAPTLSKRGKLKQVLDSLGTAATAGMNGGGNTQLDEIMQKIQALEAKKNASGAR
jgi:hypothetical protein